MLEPVSAEAAASTLLPMVDRKIDSVAANRRVGIVNERSIILVLIVYPICHTCLAY